MDTRIETTKEDHSVISVQRALKRKSSSRELENDTEIVSAHNHLCMVIEDLEAQVVSKSNLKAFISQLKDILHAIRCRKRGESGLASAYKLAFSRLRLLPFSNSNDIELQERCLRHILTVLPNDDKKKETLYLPEITARILHGDWIFVNYTYCQMYMYMLHYTHSTNLEPRDQPAEFGIILHKALDSEALAPIKLTVTRLLTTTVEFHCAGRYRLSYKQICLLKEFHKKLVTAGLGIHQGATWDVTKACLFVPITSSASDRRVNWDMINNVIHEDWRDPLHEVQPLGDDEKSDPVEFIEPQPRRLYMGNGRFVEIQDVLGRVVTVLHSGKHFFVESIDPTITAQTRHLLKQKEDDDFIESHPEHSNQSDQIPLRCPNQPLIITRKLSPCMNLLSSRFETATIKTSSTGKGRRTVLLPAEQCAINPLPLQIHLGAQFLPSLMKRLESLLLAKQLRDEIAYRVTVHVPAAKVLEALTAISCKEQPSYDRVELLGNALLKWAISRHLFLKFPEDSEGKLTTKRQEAISNRRLYELALAKHLQDYVQVDEFSPSKWMAPGLKVEENPFNSDLHGGKQYRRIPEKTLADVVEALVGVYYIEGGEAAALQIMKWLGMSFDYTRRDIEMARARFFTRAEVNVKDLETILGYRFTSRNLAVQAMTHASVSSNWCYQRLELLGDAVLDFLITRYLFSENKSSGSGMLTDLRSAAVNNETYARLSLKHGLHVHLQYVSEVLKTQIQSFQQIVESGSQGRATFGVGDIKAPKVMADIFESLAGAVYVDSQFDIDVVWKIFEPLLQPIVTPETLPVQPIRKLHELCQSQAKPVTIEVERDADMAKVTLFVDGKVISSGRAKKNKTAMKQASLHALEALEQRDDSPKPERPLVKQTLNELCKNKEWSVPEYQKVKEDGLPHAKKFTYKILVKRGNGETLECEGGAMPSVKYAQVSAAERLLEHIKREAEWL